ncbi:O-antigen ligase family protein [Patescibacteria group bacterium]|nr:O-antigen ligase family protein [Patescibacteria group bacterium]
MNLNKNRIADYCDRIIEIFLYILIFCLPFSKAIIEISATFIILTWIVKKIFNWRPVSTYLNIAIIAYILATFLSVIFSSNFALSLKNFGSKTMEYILLFFIVSEFACDKRRLKNIVIVMLASAAMIGIDCIFQYFFGFDFLRHRTLEAGRITGSFQMPGDLAGYLAPVLCLPLALYFLKLKKRLKYLLRIESMLLLSLVFISLVRGVWIGLIAGVFFLGLLENKKTIYGTAAFLLVLIMIIPYLTGTFDNIFGRLKTIFVLSDTSSLDRKAIWEVAVRMIRDRPLFGHGLSTFMGNFASFGKDYYYFKTQGLIPYAHNCYLQIAAETGIVGLVSFLWLIGTFFIHTIIFLKKIKDKFYHAVLAGISAGIIVTLVHSAVDTNLYSLQLSVLFWIMLGLNAALQRDFAFEKV